jgi:hypothetical protein
MPLAESSLSPGTIVGDGTGFHAAYRMVMDAVSAAQPVSPSFQTG